MLSDLAFHLAARGWEVEVIASRQRYDDPDAQLPRSEIIRGVQVTRIATTRFGRRFLPGRAVDYLTFYLNAFRAIRRSRGAIVVAMTDPPLLSVVAALAAPRVVNWIQDLFPEVAEGLGMRGFGLARRARDWSLRRARRNVVLGTRMAERVANVPAVVQHNWATGGLAPVDPGENPLRDQWKLGERFVVGYSGNLGRAHEFATIVAAARALPAIDFLIIGAGAQLESVREETRDLANVHFHPYQPRELLSDSLSAADVHLISLQPQLEGLIVPSKFYGVLAVARPAIFIGDRDGEVARLIDAQRCGFVVEPGDAAALVEAIRSLAADREAAEAMGRAGRALYETRFAPPIALAGWERILAEVSA
ncbi:MAG: putative colanic acid biosynthesis glycosyl transferase [Acidobacteria bacterium]|nr:putative colanic acid biosynthesis glycosyl transferase [Acidobacteriota bacterium]